MLMKRVLGSTPLYHPVHDNYLRLFKHSYWQKYVNGLRQFYRQFVEPGSLVFDVGANVGDYARCFVDLGATVVAVEPQPSCIQEIERIRPRKRITIVQSAAGSSAGFATMHVSDLSVLSSLSDEWIATTMQSGRFHDVRWDKEIRVPVVTLDHLIETYGKPSFIKIDVEGFESRVLDGLSYMPEALSFEFTGALPNSTVECLRKPVFAGSRFNYLAEESEEFGLRNWVSAEQMAAIVRTELPQTKTYYGDIIARRAA